MTKANHPIEHLTDLLSAGALNLMDTNGVEEAKWYLATIIIVDRIGKGSNIKDMARAIDGDIVQMSMGYWPQEVAQILNQRMDFEHPLVNMERTELRPYLKTALEQVNLMDFLPSDAADTA